MPLNIKYNKTQKSIDDNPMLALSVGKQACIAPCSSGGAPLVVAPTGEKFCKPFDGKGWISIFNIPGLVLDSARFKPNDSLNGFRDIFFMLYRQVGSFSMPRLPRSIGPEHTTVLISNVNSILGSSMFRARLRLYKWVPYISPYVPDERGIAAWSDDISNGIKLTVDTSVSLANILVVTTSHPIDVSKGLSVYTTYLNPFDTDPDSDATPDQIGLLPEIFIQ